LDIAFHRFLGLFIDIPYQGVPQPVENACTFLSGGEDACLAQNTQMLGDGRLFTPQGGDYLAHAPLPSSEELDYLQPQGMGKGPKKLGHHFFLFSGHRITSFYEYIIILS